MSEHGQHEGEQSPRRPYPDYPPSPSPTGLQRRSPYPVQGPTEASPHAQPGAAVPDRPLWEPPGRPRSGARVLGDPQPPGYPRPRPQPPGPSGPGTAPARQVSPRPPSTGFVPWLPGLFGLLALLPSPGLVSVAAAVVASVAMIVAGLVSRSRGGLARYNGFKAADWGLTYLLATAVLHSTSISERYGAELTETTTDFFIFYLPLVLWTLMSVFHVAYCIYAGVRAGSGRRVGFSGIPVFSYWLSAVESEH